MTTLRVNVGDEFIREGIKYLLDGVLAGYESYYVNKHDVAGTISTRIEDEPALLRDKFHDADVIIQAGAPVYWNNRFGSSCTVEWSEELWNKRIFHYGKDKAILNIAAGSCQPYPDSASSFTKDPSCAAFARQAGQSCTWTSVRDPLASHILYSLDVAHDLLPCTAFHAASRHEERRPDDIIGINLMETAGHHCLRDEVDDLGWRRKAVAFLTDLRKRHRLLFIAHNEAERTYTEFFRAPGESIFHSHKWQDYLPVYARCRAVVANRVHGAVCAAGFGRPGVIIGTDSRLLIGDCIGLASFYAPRVTPQEIVHALERGLAKESKERDRLITLRTESARQYREKIYQALAKRPETGDTPYKPRRAVKNLVRLASVKELESGPFQNFMTGVNLFARRLGLKEYDGWSMMWEYPWLWHNALAGHNWPQVRVLDIGSGLSPLPWLLASFGASVDMVETGKGYGKAWHTIKEETGLPVQWHIISGYSLPFDEGVFDLVTSFSVLEHQADKTAAVDEAVRVLKPGGILAVSFDVCEPSLGMYFPSWMGKALAMKEFERLLWRHPQLSQGTGEPQWNREDIGPFIEWHLRSAAHHHYTTAAAVLTKNPLSYKRSL